MEGAVSAADVALFGLNIIIPLMSAEILKVTSCFLLQLNIKRPI